MAAGRQLRQLRHAGRILWRRRRPLQDVPELGESRFLFLGGLHRSGTTILHDLLREHPETSAIANSGAPHDEGQHLQSVLETAARFGGPGKFAFADAAHVVETDERVGGAARNRLLLEWGPWFDFDKPVLLEKSPPNLIRGRFLQALFPGSRFAFIVRHPVAVTLATVKWSKTPVPELLEHWLAAHRIMIEDVSHLEHAIVFRYEDFVAAPDDYLARACRLCGVEPVRAARPVSDHNRRYFDAWRTPAQVSPAVLELAQSFGYSLAPPFVTEPTHRLLEYLVHEPG